MANISRKDIETKFGPAAKAKVKAQLERQAGGGVPLPKSEQTHRSRPSSKSGKTPPGWDSYEEYGYYCTELLVRYRAGEITKPERQVMVRLHVGQRYMRIDFFYFDRHLGCNVWDEYRPLGWESKKQDWKYKSWKVRRDIWCAGFGPGLLRVTTPGHGERGYHGTYHRIKVAPETLQRILRTAHQTMTPEDFGGLLSGARDPEAEALANELEADGV